MPGCVFTGVELCTRMMQFSGLYIALSLLSIVLTLSNNSLTPVIDSLRFVLLIATIVCLYNLMNQFGGVLHDAPLVRRACAGWVFVRVLSILGGLTAPHLLRDEPQPNPVLMCMKFISPLIDFVFFGILFRSAYSTRQKLEREGEPEGNLYSPLGPPRSTAPVSQLQPQQQQGVIMGQPQQGVIVQPQQQQGAIMGQHEGDGEFRVLYLFREQARG